MALELERSQTRPATTSLAVGRAIVALLVIAASPLAIHIQPGPGYGASLAMLYAVAATLAFVAVGHSPRPAFRQVVSSSALHAMLAAIVMLVSADTRDLAPHLPALTALIFLICAFLGTAAMRIDREIVVIGYVVLLLGPVWAAPALELAGNPQWATAGVLAASPLTTFALALDVDFLRGGWFYDHSAIATMRYSYPNLALPIFLFGAPPLIAALRATASNFRNRQYPDEVAT